MIKKEIIAGMNIHSMSRGELISTLKLDIDADIKHQYISITNTEAMFIASSDKAHFNYINNARLSLCDGTGVKLAGKFHGIKVDKYNGPEMMLDVFESGQAHNWNHYLLGGTDEGMEELKKVLFGKFPKAAIIGQCAPPYRELSKEEEEIMVKKINDAKPDFLWVSLGLPKQENWILKYKDQLDVKFLIGIGAAFDFHSGKIKRAPASFRKNGFEWLYRAAFEPRMYIRVWRSFRFLFGAILSNKSRF